MTAISARSSHLIERIAPLRWWEEAANISGSAADQGDELGEDYSGWPLRKRLELLAFDARLAGVPHTLLEALWEVIEQLPRGPYDFSAGPSLVLASPLYIARIPSWRTQ